MYIILPNLQIVFFVIYSIVKRFKKIFICRLIIGNIIVYYITIFPNTLNKAAYCMKLKVVKD